VNKNRNILFLLFIGVLFIISCKVTKIDDFLKNYEDLTLQILDNEKFQFLYYKHDSAGVTNIYCRGSYSKQGNYYILHPDSLQERNFNFELKQAYLDSLKSTTRIIIETNIKDFDHSGGYKIALFSDSFKLSFYGVKVDAIIKKLALRDFFVEVSLPNSYSIGTPVPSTKSILTKKISTDGYSNFLIIKIPVSYYTFFYTNIGIDTIEDLGNYWLMKNGKTVPKGRAIF
jgi:hypothetical protein